MTRAQRYPAGDRAQLTQRHPPGSLQQMHAARRKAERWCPNSAVSADGRKAPAGAQDNSPLRKQWERAPGCPAPERGERGSRLRAPRLRAFSFAPFRGSDSGLQLHTAHAVGYDLSPCRAEVGRYRFKLSCGAVVNVDDPNHAGVGRGSRTFPGASRVRLSLRERSLRR